MHSLTNINRVQINNQLMIKLFHLYEEKGKSFYYKDLFQKDEIILANQVLETNIEYFARYLNLDLTEARIKLLSNIKKNYTPKNNDEILLRNIKSVLKLIHNSNEDFFLRLNSVKDLVGLLFRGYENVKLNKKGKPFDSRTTHPFEELSSEGQLEEIINLYHKVIRKDEVELLMVIFNFYVDFILIEPYNKYNELIALLLIYAIIYKEFPVCRYDSFFKTLLAKKENFELALAQAKYGWESGFSQVDSLVRLISDVLIEMHKNLKDKKHDYIFEVKMNKQDSIEGIILRGPDIFTKTDIRKKAPLASESTINRTLQMLKNRNIITPLGKGRSAKWQRLTEKQKKFSVEQLTIFGDK